MTQTAKSINPYTGEVIKKFPLFTFNECITEIQKCKTAFSQWRILPISERTEYITKVADNLRDNKRRYAETITEEMGRPIRDSLAEIEKCAWLCDYYAENSEKFLQDELIPTEAKKSYVTFQPLGIILGIMPWNFPFWQVFRFAIPAITAGDVCLLKHASNVFLSALNIEKVFEDSGLPFHVFKTLLINSSTAMQLVEREKVDGVSLTGSVSAGSQIGALAGKHIRKIVLELGGSDPFIVLDDAPVGEAAETAAKARLINTGQSCIAAKRFIVMESLVKEFQDKFIEHFQGLTIGDPMDERTDIGPVAKKDIADELKRQLDDAKEKGARIILGPKPPRGQGFFFPPAVVTDVKPNMKVLREEVFGPIAPIISAQSEEEIVEIANSTEFGLGAAIWSKDVERAENLALRIDAGFVAINDLVKSDPRLPFGGIKKSGVGRELSYVGLKEFVNIKSIVVK